MKKVIYILILISIFTGFYSCEKDSLGITDYNKKILDDDIYDEDGYSKYGYDVPLPESSIKAVNFLTQAKPTGESFEYVLYDVSEKMMKIDTTRGDTTIWLEIGLERPADYVKPGYMNHLVKSFSIKISRAEYDKIHKIENEDRFQYLYIIVDDYLGNPYNYYYHNVISAIEFYPDKIIPDRHYCDIDITFPSRDYLSIKEFQCTISFSIENN